MSQRYGSGRDERRRDERRAQAQRQRRDPKTGRFVSQHERARRESNQRGGETQHRREGRGDADSSRSEESEKQLNRYEGGGREPRTTAQRRRDPQTGRFVSGGDQSSERRYDSGRRRTGGPQRSGRGQASPRTRDQKTGRYLPRDAGKPQSDRTERRYGKRRRERNHRRHRP